MNKIYVIKGLNNTRVFTKMEHCIECIVFEDAQAGVEAAKAGNMRAIGIGDADMLSQADKVIPSFVVFKQLNYCNFKKHTSTEFTKRDIRLILYRLPNNPEFT